MARHLLVTNDFPPKVGGIQSYLWELWRRLPPGDATVLTAAHPHAPSFDAAQPFRVERTSAKVLIPTPALRRRVVHLADAVGAEVVVVDPALPLGLLARHLRRPYVVVLHGSELVARLPGGGRITGRVVSHAAAVVAAGNYPAAEAERMARGRAVRPVVIPPGVDCGRFVPLDPATRASARLSFGVPESALVVVGLSRLVPRKGFDVLIRAAAQLAPRHPNLVVLIGGDGRDRPRLERIISRTRAPVRLLGRVPDHRLPALYGIGDVFAMCCRTRWGGLEPEGFGIVFLEAAACGVPQLAGDSGGVADAVVDGHTGTVISRPGSVTMVTAELASLLDQPELRIRMGQQSRDRARADFDYDRLAERLKEVIDEAAGRPVEPR